MTLRAIHSSILLSWTTQVLVLLNNDSHNGIAQDSVLGDWPGGFPGLRDRDVPRHALPLHIVQPHGVHPNLGGPVPQDL